MENKLSDHSEKTLSQSSSSFNNILIRFIFICSVIFIITALFDLFNYGFSWDWFYPLNLLCMCNPIFLFSKLIYFLFGFNLYNFFIIPWHRTIFSIFDTYDNLYNDEVIWYSIKLIIGVTLTAIGLALNYLIAKTGLKETDKSDDDMIYQPILNIKEIINNSSRTGFNHASTIIGSSILWILTIWIPYINAGATIGILGMIPALAKNEKFSPLDIFNKKYRKNMGEYFLLVALMSTGISVGFLFLGFPGAVIAIAWSQAIFLHIDKGFTPLKAINISNDITYGEKMKMFFSFVLLVLFYGIILGIVMAAITVLELYMAIAFIALAGQLLMSLIITGYYIYIYGQISKKLST